jgi:hypothetical protein
MRPVIEYAYPLLWQSSQIGEQIHQLGHVQQRAISIITGSADYEMQCALLDVEPIYLRLNRLAMGFFDKVYNSDSCLRSLLPPERPFGVTKKASTIQILFYTFVPHRALQMVISIFHHCY